MGGINQMSALKETLMQTEERHKEKVYKAFIQMKQDAYASVEAKQRNVDSGAYEDQAAFMIYGDLAAAERERRDTEILVQGLYAKPYFAHIEIREENEKETEHYYLSDCENLDRMVKIGNDGWLIPFKQDTKRPISSALFHCYQQKKGDPVSYSGRNGLTIKLEPQLICDDDILHRKLRNAIQFYPETEEFQIDADELLEQKLQENRDNPVLRNIIATLQQKQFQIIATDANESFVVQGCAGSGKSQCLLHRLFFLRDTLSQDGWTHVLLLTPTQLFRNHSAELIKRFQLSDINDCSIAELYRNLLTVYDQRFKNRQYHFELSEEYLPDEYLKVVYDPKTISRIDSEIQNAINNYVEAGCRSLGIDMPDIITATYITRLVEQIDSAMEEFDSRETVLQQDPEYISQRQKYEDIQKELDSVKKSQDRATADYQKVCEDEMVLLNYLAVLTEAKEERERWCNERKKRVYGAIGELEAIAKRMETEDSMGLPARYAQQLFTVQSLMKGQVYKSDEGYAAFLNEYCQQAEKDLMSYTNNQSVEKIQKRYAKKKENLSKRMISLSDKAEQLSADAEIYANWLRDKASSFEGEQSRRTIRRSDMERARYFLARIESAVFEREVWNALAPIKEEHNIQTLDIEILADGHQKESRILYKSDLLFYVKIYAGLHPDAGIPEYTLLCIDEGQDLHKADYDLLHMLYPKAVFNVFGDTEQVLHTSCGIKDWKTETGVNKVYPLTRNYRNTAEIVEFCNRRFKSQMDYVGTVGKNQKPSIIEDLCSASIPWNNMVVIVKNHDAYIQFCAEAGKKISDFEYLDTKSSSSSREKPVCYSIFAAKGLEFSSVFVFARNMTQNQRVVACTRAMEKLYYYE